MTHGYSRLFDRALVLASLVHENVPRKGTIVPYVIHPVHVATILLRHGYGETLGVAAVLHDVLEDVQYDNGRLQLAIRSAFPRAGLPDLITPPGQYRAVFKAFLQQEFPGEVIELVQAVTEPKNQGGPPVSWDLRKQDTLERLRDAPDAVVALKAADALHNVQSILEDIEHHGATVLNRFKVPPEKTRWYYGSLAAIARERLRQAPLADELSEAMTLLERFIQGSRDS